MNQKLMTQNLSFSIKGKVLLNDISLEFNRGNLHAILGANGSGKSTLLKVLTGIWMPISGSVLWNDQSLLEQSRQSISRIISLVPQNPQPAFNYSVQDIVAMGRYLYNKRYWDVSDESLIDEALRAVDVLHLKKRLIIEISCGERQRVYIARALVSKCPVLLLDEPTASLDIRHKTEIWDLLRDIAKKDKTVIIATHDLRVAEKYCDKVAVLDHGNLRGNGPLKTTLSPELFAQAFGVSCCPSS